MADAPEPASPPSGELAAASAGDTEFSSLPTEQRHVFEHIERRIARFEQIVRQDNDPYGGLPSPEILAQFERQRPDLDLTKLLLERADREQSHRHEIERSRLELERQDVEVEKYSAETERIELQSYFEQQRFNRRYAMSALVVMLAAGAVAVFMHQPVVAAVIFGASIVGVVAAFMLRQGANQSGSGNDK